MKLLLLFWRLLRYRVAVMLILFMLLAAAIHGSVTSHAWPLVLAAVALAFSYVSATSSNDLADRKIDAINHPQSVGRPLITGAATPADMWRLFAAASIIALLLGYLINPKAAALMALSVLINVAYSLPPLRLSYRTFLAPLTLAVAYVGVPYTLAIVVVHSRFTSSDYVWLAGLYCLFVGRIILKDFRDRAGDRQYGKPTFLLKFGKRATCIFSLVGLTVGGTLMTVAVAPHWLAVFLWAYLAGIAFMLLRLYRAKPGHEEQLAIGVGARLGNGLIITLLAAEVLTTANAQLQVLLLALFLLAVAYYGSFFVFLRDPQGATIGYKG